MSSLRGTVSNALMKSRYITSNFPPLSRISGHLSVCPLPNLLNSRNCIRNLKEKYRIPSYTKLYQHYRNNVRRNIEPT